MPFTLAAIPTTAATVANMQKAIVAIAVPFKIRLWHLDVVKDPAKTCERLLQGGD